MTQYNLGLMLLQGDGIDKNMKHGLELLQKAAIQHHVQAQLVLNLINTQK